MTIVADHPHRKQVRRYDLPGHAHALTFSCYRRLDLLTEDRVLVLLSESVNRAVVRCRFGLLGFVFMPNHVHLLVWPQTDDARISDLLHTIKRPFAFRVHALWREDCNPWMGVLWAEERQGEPAFRFWQRGGGFDRNLADEDGVRATLGYLHANPVRRGLVEDPSEWRWSSWHHWHGDTVPEHVPQCAAWPW